MTKESEFEKWTASLAGYRAKLEAAVQKRDAYTEKRQSGFILAKMIIARRVAKLEDKIGHYQSSANQVAELLRALRPPEVAQTPSEQIIQAPANGSDPGLIRSASEVEAAVASPPSDVLLPEIG